MRVPVKSNVKVLFKRKSLQLGCAYTVGVALVAVERASAQIVRRIRERARTATATTIHAPRAERVLLQLQRLLIQIARDHTAVVSRCGGGGGDGRRRR